ncbi:M23 family metallopeptidase [Paenibacillus xylanilyticus]|uniref:M23 family metallopeptidase n=1 Tax=Paenibacillus xylanilyticus TaxID=248903 RepID=A0A7Y6ETE3_9BACL|nr:M23 family metallopeptidase [Paenibacillus xylanilyticus]NUU74471.1 M23 family metallopeptidase [Paenibacillus xylanilyticus]
MNTKLRIKQRREERIRRLLDGAAMEIMQEAGSGPGKKGSESQVPHSSFDIQGPVRSVGSLVGEQERDPEWLWKKENGRYVPGGHVRFNLTKSFVRRTVVSALIFGAVWGLFQLNSSWTASPKTAIADALHRDMDFASAALWYERHFGGTPSFLPVLGNTTDAANGSGVRSLLDKPISGTVVQPFALSMKGIEIVPEAEGTGMVQVVSSDAGRVMQVLGDSESGITVVIQHTGNLTAIYGRLNESEVDVNDWVEAGSAVGSLKATGGEQPATLYFAVKEGEEYVDPAEVVALD